LIVLNVDDDRECAETELFNERRASGGRGFDERPDRFLTKISTRPYGVTEKISNSDLPRVPYTQIADRCLLSCLMD